MIGRLNGTIVTLQQEQLLLDVHGVGYELFVPVRLAAALVDGSSVVLHVHTHLREGALELFGFLEAVDRAAFRMLISVNGIGPRLALAVLGRVAVSDLVQAVQRKDLEMLTTIPGIGKRTAERLLIELAGKVDRLALAGGAPSSISSAGNQDLLSALINLGYPKAKAESIIDRLPISASSPIEQRLREALRVVGREA